MSRIDGYVTKNERSEDLCLWITSRVYQLLRFAQKVVLILSLRLRWDCLMVIFYERSEYVADRRIRYKERAKRGFVSGIDGRILADARSGDVFVRDGVSGSELVVVYYV
jgi:hypothetical protein